MARVWTWAKPKLAVCAIFGLLVEGVGSWRAGHWLDADGCLAAEDRGVCAVFNAAYWIATSPLGHEAGDEGVCR
jgi:hypothetical protein